jgi:peptidoglycan/xylan/chitin deacetylase (PgdA/CDA1 family)
MHHKSVKLHLIIVGLSLWIAGCSIGLVYNASPKDPQYHPTSTEIATITSTPFQAITNTPSIIPPSNTSTATDTHTPTNTPVPTDTPLPTVTPFPTNTPLPTATSDVVWTPAGQVTASILLYHHVSNEYASNRYYVSIDRFRAQMKALREWGYTSITISELVNVIINGGNLPNKPVVITFDDGNLDVYQNAFPIMHELGLVGTTFIIANALHSNYSINVEQLKEMSADGWEIGSHSMTHKDLTIDHSIANYEIQQSLLTLKEAIGAPISSFAYPYGKTDEFVSTKVSEYGYTAGVGLGMSHLYSPGTLYYLNRREVQSDYNMIEFASLLPWSGN